MGALSGRVNRSAGSRLHDDFRVGNPFDKQPRARPKPPKLSAGEHDVLAAPIGGDPNPARLTVNPASLWKMPSLDSSFENLMGAAGEGCLGILSRQTESGPNGPSEPAFARDHDGR